MHHNSIILYVPLLNKAEEFKEATDLFSNPVISGSRIGYVFHHFRGDMLNTIWVVNCKTRKDFVSNACTKSE